MEQTTITLAKFLSRYMNLTGIDIKKMTHEEVKELMPNIKRLPFDYVKKNMELVYRGEVLLVDDGNNIIPYETPEILETIVPKKRVYRYEKRKRKPRINIDFSCLSIFELKLLLKRKFNTSNHRKKAEIELNNRGVVLHKKFRYEKDLSRAEMEERNAKY